MGDKDYSFDDLIWEAVRRNQDYRTIYDNIRASEEALDDFEAGWDEKWADYSWSRWHLKKTFDYNLTVDDIKRKIKSGEMKDTDHPYFNYIALGREYVNYEKLPKSVYLNCIQAAFMDITEEEKKELLFWACEFFLRNNNRVIVSLDPFENEASVVGKIKIIMKDVSKRRKKELSLKIRSLKKDTHEKGNYEKKCQYYISKIYKPKIQDLIGILKKYDEIYSRVISKTHVESEASFHWECGTFVLPKKFKFKEILTTSEIEAEKRSHDDYLKSKKNNDYITMSMISDNAIKTLAINYQRAYKRATELIRSAPDRMYFY